MSSESKDGCRGVILEIDGSVKDFNYTGYQSLREAVGGNIECCTTAQVDGNRYDLWGNEEGRLRNLPNNRVAQKIAAHMGGFPIEQVLSLHGVFVILGSNELGETVAAPESIIALAKTFAISEDEAKEHQEACDEPFTRVYSWSDERN